MLGVVATLKVKRFKTLGRTRGEFMDGRPEVLRRKDGE